MDRLLVLLSATALTAPGLIADRIDRDLRGGGHLADRPMRLDLLTLLPEEFARVGPAGIPPRGECVDRAWKSFVVCPPWPAQDARTAT